MITEDYIEKILKQQFKKTLEFELNGKIFKRGKLDLYRLETYSNNFEITLMFEKPENKIENFKLPYPFKYEYYEEDSLIFFDYRLFTLANNNIELEAKLKKISEPYSTKSKYFNSILKIYCK